MSRFRVGQRVRVTYIDCYSYGVETEVTAVGECGFDEWGTFYGVEVDIQHAQSVTGRCVYREHMLTPIDDPGCQETTTWAQCVWQPKQVQA